MSAEFWLSANANERLSIDGVDVAIGGLCCDPLMMRAIRRGSRSIIYERVEDTNRRRLRSAVSL